MLNETKLAYSCKEKANFCGRAETVGSVRLSPQTTQQTDCAMQFLSGCGNFWILKWVLRQVGPRQVALKINRPGANSLIFPLRGDAPVMNVKGTSATVWNTILRHSVAIWGVSFVRSSSENGDLSWLRWHALGAICPAPPFCLFLLIQPWHFDCSLDSS